jgi:hypothetical protein
MINRRGIELTAFGCELSRSKLGTFRSGALTPPQRLQDPAENQVFGSGTSVANQFVEGEPS